jgi:hypothetical protein
MSIITLLGNRRTINTFVMGLLSCLTSDRVRTRHQVDIITKPCRLWQLHFCVLTILYSINANAIENIQMLITLCDSVKNFYTDTRSPLYNYIAGNTLPIWPNSICYIEHEAEFRQHIMSDTNYKYLCLYGRNKSTGAVLPNSIGHYFTIIKNSNSYFLTSSYASDHICAPYDIQRIDNIAKFFNFCNNLRTRTRSEDIGVETELIDFMIKYFFPNVMRQRYDVDAVEFNQNLRPLWINPEEGIKAENKYILNNSVMNFDVALIPNYEAAVRAELFEQPGRGVKRKVVKTKKSRKQRRHKSLKNKKSKHKFYKK